MNQFKSLWKALKSGGFWELSRLMGDYRTSMRMNYLYAALDSGLLDALQTPRSRDELVQELQVQREELLDALLDVGQAVGELEKRDGVYSLKGRRSRALCSAQGDGLRGIVEAGVTYYNSVYQQAGARMRGAALGNYLEEMGLVVARFSTIVEPFIHEFVVQTVAGKGEIQMLEVGCGSGVYLRIAAQANPQVHGIGLELDPQVVEQTQQNLQRWGLSDRFQVLQGDISDPPEAADRCYDLITLYNLIYYFSPEARTKLLLDLRSRLSPGGELALVSSFRSMGKDLSSANLNLATSSMNGCFPLPDLEELRLQIEASGFQRVRQYRLVPGEMLYGLLAG